MNPPKKESLPFVQIVKADEVQIQKVGWPSIDNAAASSIIPLPHEPQVEIQSQPDGSGKIIVTCTCGRRIEVQCNS